MNINRRKLLSGAAATSAAFCLKWNSGLSSVFAQNSPRDLASDPRRPQFHLLPAKNWMNDPNGPIYWKGNYHMFYQYNPDGAFWGDMHWGHAIGPDMVHWTHLPVALSPTPGGPDADGCFSGSAVIDGDKVAVVYTGVASAPAKDATLRDVAHSFRETQCVATSSDAELRAWSKLPAPVIGSPPKELRVTGFRDPSPWRHGEWWYMVFGSGIEHHGGAVLLYKSRDLLHWEYLHVVAGGLDTGKSSSDPVDSGDMWECPDLFRLGEKHVLIYSTQGKAYWQTGDLDEKELRFHPEQQGILDHGSFYAPKTQLDAAGNRILWGWIPETLPLQQYRAAGWAGMMSLPRVLKVMPNSQLTMRVSSAMDKLRKKQQVLQITANEQENRQQIERMYIENCCGEILCVFKSDFAACGLSLFGILPDGRTTDPWFALRFGPGIENQLSIDGKAIPGNFTKRSSFEVHMYIDGSVAEVFINNRAAYTKRFYYSGSQAPRATLRILGKTTNLSSLSMWQLTPISPDRLTT